MFMRITTIKGVTITVNTILETKEKDCLILKQGIFLDLLLMPSIICTTASAFHLSFKSNLSLCLLPYSILRLIEGPT